MNKTIDIDTLDGISFDIVKSQDINNLNVDIEKEPDNIDMCLYRTDIVIGNHIFPGCILSDKDNIILSKSGCTLCEKFKNRKE